MSRDQFQDLVGGASGRSLRVAGSKDKILSKGFTRGHVFFYLCASRDARRACHVTCLGTFDTHVILFVYLFSSGSTEMAGMVSSLRTEIPSTSMSAVASNATTDAAHPLYAVRIQSSRFSDDNSLIPAPEMKRLLERDIEGRTTWVGDGIAADLFSDGAFGFPINDQFVKHFCGSIISTSKMFDAANFKNESTTAAFLNRMVTTIAKFLQTTNKTSLVPLRYFTDAHANTPIVAQPGKLKPDIIVAPLIDGCVRTGLIDWKNVKSLVELTQEKTCPPRMAHTVLYKSYMTFCHQPDRDFVPFFCFSSKGVHIVVLDHSGVIETDLIPYNRTATTLIIFRMVMGIIFLPDSYLGFDSTITRRDNGIGGEKFDALYPPFENNFPNASIQLFVPDPLPTHTNLSPTTLFNSDDGITDCGIVSISVNSKPYRVIRVIFRSQSMIGRATKAFLVKLPDNKLGVIKDSWITTDRAKEADFLTGLNIPFGPKLHDHCILRNTGAFRDNPICMSPIQEHREKRRVVTYPAGVHISDFSSLWELMVAMLDVVVGMIDSPFLFDCSADHF